MSITDRIVWADALKGWLMVLVIVQHVIQSLLGDEYYYNLLSNLISSFHMPAFMALSGYLMCKKSSICPPPILHQHTHVHHIYNRRCENYKHELIDSFKRRSQQLLIPYFLWSMIQFVFSGSRSIEYLSKIIIAPDGFYWFLWCLFWISILFKTMQLACSSSQIREDIGLGFMCLLLLILMVVFEIRICGFQFIAYYFLFYTIGYMIHKYTIQLNNILMFILSLAWLLLAWKWTMHGVPSWLSTILNCQSSVIQYAYRGLTAMIATTVLLSLAPKSLNATIGINGFIAKTGTYSLGIYVCHRLILKHGGITQILLSSNFSYSFCLVLGTITCFMISYCIVLLLNKNATSARLFLGKINPKKSVYTMR
jgi:fucose 4-O-acetylase-like acetyltransferase